MIKKVSVEKLVKGVFVHDFQSNWIKHPFLFGKMLIKTDKQLERIYNSGIEEVYIDTTKGRDIIELLPKEEIQKLFQSEFDDLILKMPEPAKVVTVKEELRRASEIKNEANKIVHEIDHEIRSGKKLQVQKIDLVIEKMIDSVSRNRDALITLMSVREMDEYTFMHSVRVSVLVMAFCKYLEMDPEETKLYSVGALLHDIGKLKIPLEVINKPGKLSPSEFRLMKKHPRIGKRILEELDGVSEEVIEMVYQHHEKFDGSGYPQGISGDAIEVGAQYISIASIYDTLISKTVYSEAIEPTEALKIIYDMRGKELDPETVELFIKAMGIFPLGSLVRLQNDLLAVVVESRVKFPLQPKIRIFYDIRKQIKLVPRDLDLSENDESNFQIKSAESTNKWNIDPTEYLNKLAH